MLKAEKKASLKGTWDQWIFVCWKSTPAVQQFRTSLTMCPATWDLTRPSTHLNKYTGFFLQPHVLSCITPTQCKANEITLSCGLFSAREHRDHYINPNLVEDRSAVSAVEICQECDKKHLSIGRASLRNVAWKKQRGKNLFISIDVSIGMNRFTSSAVI